MKNGIIFFGYEKRQDSDMSWLTLEGNEKFLVAQVVWEYSQCITTTTKRESWKQSQRSFKLSG